MVCRTQCGGRTWECAASCGRLALGFRDGHTWFGPIPSSLSVPTCKMGTLMACLTGLAMGIQ